MGPSGAFGKARSIDDAAKDKDKKDRDPVAPGSYTSAAIIMLTDGQRTTGVDRWRPPRWPPIAACVLHRRHRHGERRDHRLRGLVDACAAR